MWNRISKAWKTLVKFTYVRGPDNFDEWLDIPKFLVGSGAKYSGPGFSKSRGAQLYRAGLKRNLDAWDFTTNSIKTIEAVQADFGSMRITEFQAWEALRQREMG